MQQRVGKYQFPAQYLRRVEACIGDWIVYCEPRKVADRRENHPRHRVDVAAFDVHRAVGGPRIFAIGNEDPNPDCAVEKVDEALEEALRAAETLLVERLGSGEPRRVSPEL